MIPLALFLYLATVAGALALYSFLERQSWMYSQIAAAALATSLLWVLALMLATGNVNVAEKIDQLNQPLLDPTMPFLFALFAIVMTIYFVLHVATWLQDRIHPEEEEEEE